MDIASLFGILAAFGLVSAAIAMGSGLSLFFSPESLLIVLGGTMGATLIHYPVQELRGAFKVARNAFFRKPILFEDRIRLIVDLSNKARREGILSLEKDLGAFPEDPFLQKAVQLAVDGLEPEMIRDILRADLEALEDRHEVGSEIFSTMGTFAPALGMIGTLIGLIQMLQNLDNPDAIGPGMAVALLTTFYGSVFANLICLPIAGKLRTLSKLESRQKSMLTDGVVSLAKGENPRILEQKMLSYLPPRRRESRFRKAASSASPSSSAIRFPEAKQ